MVDMTTAIREVPPFDEMYQALCDRNSEYEGQFFVGVWTTGVFCRPTCPARKPKRENIDFFPTANDALSAGFRPCKRCHPLEVFGTAPQWLRGCLNDIQHEPNRRWTDAELRARDVEPTRLRRWFKQHHGMTFHSYLRTHRLGIAMEQINNGGKNTTGAALANGYESLSGFRAAFKYGFGNAPTGSNSTTQPVLLNRMLTSPLAGADPEKRV